MSQRRKCIARLEAAQSTIAKNLPLRFLLCTSEAAIVVSVAGRVVFLQLDVYCAKSFVDEARAANFFDAKAR
jgi:hypothetical protein